MPLRRSIILVSLLVPIEVALVACTSSKEWQACEAEQRWAADVDVALGREPIELTREQLGECAEQQKATQVELSLTDAEYEALLDCKIAAADMDEGLACFGPAIAKRGAATRAGVEAELNAALSADQAEADAAIAKLEAHVGAGVSAETIASLRRPKVTVPPARIAVVATDAVTLIESRRVDAAHPLTINLQPGFGVEARPPIGLEGAELTFTDRASGATIGRVAPLPANQFGVKTSEITVLIAWMLEQPDARRVELIATPAEYGTGLVFEPPEILRETERFAAAGLADRPMIWLEGKPYTLTQWWAR